MYGSSNRASAAAPSAAPAPAPSAPASVEESPLASTVLITWLRRSAMNSVLAAKASPAGELSLVAPAAPSTAPAPAPRVPATVETVPAPRSTIRITWFPASLTYKYWPPPDRAQPAGESNCATAASPSMAPGSPATPASVCTPPAAVCLRIRWLPVSVRYTARVAASRAMSVGRLKRAARTRPGRASAAPGPAPTRPVGVVTVPGAGGAGSGSPITRTTWLAASVRYSASPAAARPSGVSNLASSTAPLSAPETPKAPATVCTLPVAKSTDRTAALIMSARYMVWPTRSRPMMAWKRATSGSGSSTASGEAMSPATVETSPVAREITLSAWLPTSET
mmetsp:Transcript_15745/g.39335  ORF Transcript_15745/g.39335 Transcript_15745/m.39335 type:complete len:337 (+) Transcript_15745:424-1434(+)